MRRRIQKLGCLHKAPPLQSKPTYWITAAIYLRYGCVADPSSH